MFWIFIIAIIGIFLYTKYNRDKEQLHNKIASRGGMRELFSPFLLAAESDFGPANVTKATDTELEIFQKLIQRSIFIGVLRWDLAAWRALKLILREMQLILMLFQLFKVELKINWKVITC